MKNSLGTLLSSLLVFIALAVVSSVAPIHAAETLCTANNLSAVKTCFDQFNSGQISIVEITQPIACDPSTACQFQVKRTSPGKIYGTPGSNAGFIRKTSFSAPILFLNSASHITVSNLNFNDEVASLGCTWTSWSTPTNCLPQLRIHNSSDLILEQLKLTNSKGRGIEISGHSKDIAIKNTTVSNTYEQGIIFVPPNIDTISIEGSTFTNTGGAGTPISGKNVSIKNNSFSRSQWKTPWKIGGGQINVNGVQGGVISGNNIFNGIAFHESPKEFIGGIEFSRNTSNLSITDNNITGNTAAALYNDAEVTLTNVAVNRNRIVNNGSNWIKNRSLGVPNGWDGVIHDLTQGKAHWTVTNNCTTTSCDLPPPNGVITIVPNPCYLKSGQTTCAVSVSWLANFAAEVKLKNGTAEVGTGNQGAKVLTNISTKPTVITLISGNKILASQKVSATTLGDISPTSGSKKPGDLTSPNGKPDGKVDIYDYNYLLSKFNQPYTIFDYNTLVSGFGK